MVLIGRTGSGKSATGNNILDTVPLSGVENEYRIALIGRTGNGKSATGNNILGKKYFISKMCRSSVTRSCAFRTAERFGKKVVVVDTPGLFDVEISNKDILKEIVKCIGILTPGPHAFILVVQVGRFTPEEQATVDHFSRIFGEEFFRYLIVLFTRRDDLENNGMTIHEYVKEVPDELKDILQRCGNKYIAFDNSPKGQKTDSDTLELIKILDAGISYYPSFMFEKAEKEFQGTAEEFRLKEKEKIQKYLEATQKKIEAKKREIEAKRKKIEAKELELQTKEKENGTKEREIVAREIENAKLGLGMKFELEEREKRYLKQLENMLEVHRKENENKNENIIDWFTNVQSVRNSVLGLIFLLLLSLVFAAFEGITTSSI